MIKSILIESKEYSDIQLGINGVLHLEDGTSIALRKYQHIILVDTKTEIVKGDEFKYFESNNGLIKQIISNNLLVKTPGKYYKIISSTNKLSYIKHDDTVPYPSGEQIIIPQLSPQSIRLLINYYNEHKCMPESVDIRMVSKEIVDEDGDWQPTRKVIRLNQQGEVDITIPEEEIIGKPMEDYIRAKHTQEECVGFIDGWGAAKEKLFTEEQLREAYFKGFTKAMDGEDGITASVEFSKWFNSKKK